MDEPSSSEMSRPPPHAGGGENQDRKQRQKVKKQVCEEVVRRLKAQGHPYTQVPSYADELLAHFMRLPTRYVRQIDASKRARLLASLPGRQRGYAC